MSTDRTGWQPERVQLSRAKGWKMPLNTVKVTRPGPWGNPFVVWFGADAFGVDRWHVSYGSCHWPAPTKEAATALAVEKHEKWLRSWLADQIVAPRHVLHELRGKNLACWCALGTPCHADALLRLANSDLPAPAAPTEPKPQCDCRQCIRDRGDTIGGLPREMCQMILCPSCGNKRCPHATDHRHACTGSNDPGQPGSVYGPTTEPKP